MQPELRPDVVAGKYDPALFDPTGLRLLVNEVFATLQGEGEHAGRAAVFVRFAKCNLKCAFCDTEFEVGEHIEIETLIRRIDALNPAPQSHGRPLVVLTGGEPALQNLRPLCIALRALGYDLALETSGSVWAPWMREAVSEESLHICISPKVRLSTMNEELLLAAAEVKWIVNAAFLTGYGKNPDDFFVPGVENYLQPESQNQKWTTAAVKLVQQWPGKYRLSLQTHKYINLP